MKVEQSLREDNNWLYAIMASAENWLSLRALELVGAVCRTIDLFCIILINIKSSIEEYKNISEIHPMAEAIGHPFRYER